MDRIKLLKEYLLATPGDAFLQHALALEYIKLGQDAEARQVFEELLGREPGYVGSYYHLAKLLERTGEQALAVEWYEKGMEVARTANNKHAYGELKSAYEELMY